VFSGSDLVTALRVRGTDYELVMLAGKKRFTFGTSAECDLVVDNRRVSHSHALLERRDNRIIVIDMNSKHGLCVGGRKEAQFDLYAGGRFSVDEAVFYLLNDEMRLHRPVMAEILGPERMTEADDLVMAAMHGGPIVLHAEPGCDQERLARAIHGASLRRRHHFIVANPGPDGASPPPHLVERTNNGTLFLPLAGTAAADAAFLEALRRPENNVRLIVSATSVTDAIQRLGDDAVGGAHRARIAPIRDRPGEISGLLERWFIDRGARRRFSDFTDDNQAALRAHRWPRNLEELRDAADMLAQLAPYPSERRASEEANIPRTNVKRWLDAIGLTMPLIRDLETP
jgi:two-component system, NtrC family, response regulator GlrR